MTSKEKGERFIARFKMVIPGLYWCTCCSSVRVYRTLIYQPLANPEDEIDAISEGNDIDEEVVRRIFTEENLL